MDGIEKFGGYEAMSFEGLLIVSFQLLTLVLED